MAVLTRVAYIQIRSESDPNFIPDTETNPDWTAEPRNVRRQSTRVRHRVHDRVQRDDTPPGWILPQTRISNAIRRPARIPPRRGVAASRSVRPRSSQQTRPRCHRRRAASRRVPKRPQVQNRLHHAGRISRYRA